VSVTTRRIDGSSSAITDRVTERVMRTPGTAEAPDALDPVAVLAAFVKDGPGLSSTGLADQLQAFVAPQPRHPESLLQPRIVALLDLAAQVLRLADADETIIGLGYTAVEQELRQHRALADRRASLIER
jgi:hypothetical protein